MAFCGPGESIELEMESSPKKPRAYGPNTSAVLHATGDLRLVRGARGLKVFQLLADLEYSFSSVASVRNFSLFPLRKRGQSPPRAREVRAPISSQELRRVQTAL